MKHWVARENWNSSQIGIPLFTQKQFKKSLVPADKLSFAYPQIRSVPKLLYLLDRSRRGLGLDRSSTMEVHTYCGCCVQRARGERCTGFYVVPMPVFVPQHDHHEPQPLYFHQHHQSSHAWRSRWLRRMEKEEEEEICEAPFQHRKNRVHSCRNSTKDGKEKEKQDELLKTLVQRLEALETGMKCLARARNGPKLPQKPQRRPACRCVARTNPAADCAPTGGVEPCKDALKRRFNSEGRSTMNREEAAMVIQSRFRAYLVRRSQSLRHLRHLAMLKMSLKELKTLFSHARFKRLLCRDADQLNSFYEKASALLLEVDSVQDSDLLVREARRSLSKELVTLLHSLDDMVTQSAAAAATNSSVQGREDMTVNERLRMSSDYFDCSGEAAMPHSEEEEEIIQEGYATDTDLFSCMRNRKRNGNRNGLKHRTPADFDMPRFANRKNGSRRFGFPEMADFHYDYYDFPF